MQDLGVLPGGGGSIAWAVSANGSVVAGEADGEHGAQHAFRWTAPTGMVDLGAPPPSFQSWATGLSGDGSVVSGYVEPAPWSSFRWTAGEGFTLLGILPG